MLLIGLLPKKCLKKIDDSVFSNDDIVFVNTDSDNVLIFSDDIYLNDVNFDDDDLETVIHVKIMAWCNIY